MPIETTVTHSCGHLEFYRLNGGPAERARKALSMGDYPCRMCEADTLSEHPAVPADLPELTGSTGQRDWAAKLRAEAAIATAGVTDTDARALLLRQRNAKFWIEARPRLENSNRPWFRVMLNLAEYAKKNGNA